MRPGALLSPILLLLVSMSCGTSRDAVLVIHDLTELYPEARVMTDTSYLDLGSGTARPHLLEGWSADELATDGTTFVWAVGARSSLNLFLSRPRPVSFRFRAWPFHFHGAPTQTVGLRVNGLDLEPVPLAPGPEEYSVTLPKGVLQAGNNRVDLVYAYHRAPSEVLAGAGDQRDLAVGWDWIRLEGLPAIEQPRVSGSGENGALVLPQGVRLVYYLDVPPDSVLTVDGLRRLDNEGGGETQPETPVLRIDAMTLHEHSVQLVEDEARTIRSPLPATGGLVRLELDASSSRGIVLRHPTVRGRPAEPRLPRRTASEPPRPNIILVVIDTLRADHLGCYGYARDTSAHLDRFAKEATQFENAVAQSSWTRPSVASVMTGLLPRAHSTTGRTDALPDEINTLAERLTGLGYESAGFVTNTNVDTVFGFDQGYDTYELLVDADLSLGYARADALVDRALTFLEDRRTRPFFLYLHANDPHDPYASSEGSVGTMAFMKSLESGEIEAPDSLRDELVALYDDEIRFADSELGRFFDALKERELYESSLVIVLSDHGEEFYDHQWWRHGKTLYHEQLHVPLLIKWPNGDGAGLRFASRAQQIDVLPTLLDYVGAPASDLADLPGRSLWRLVTGGEDDGTVAAASHLAVDGRHLQSVYVGNDKLLRYYTYDRDKPVYELFDFQSDPKESRNLADEEEARVDFLDGILRRPIVGPEAAPRPAVITEETERRLRALGYVR